jgi:alpha-glucoside transport system substrate-binding protein
MTDREASTGNPAARRSGPSATHAGRARRWLIPLCTLLAAVALALSACGGDDDSSDGNAAAGGKAKGGPLTVWLGGVLATATPGSDLRKWYDAEVASFESRYPGTKIKTVLLNPDGVKQSAQYRAAFAADKGPDVGMISPGGFTTQFESSLEDLGKVAPDVVDQFPDHTLQYGCKDFDCENGAAKLLIPNDVSGWVLAYNKQIFDKVGVKAPFESWDDLVAAGKKLKAAGYVPFQMGNRDGYVSDAYLSNMESSYLTPDDISAVLSGDLQLTDAKFVDPLALWAQLYSDGLVNENACSLETLASQRDFFAGKAATVASYDYANLYKNLKGKLGVMTWPPIDGAPSAADSGEAVQVGQGWAIPKGSQNPALATAFLKHITSADTQTRMFEQTGTPPANPKASTANAPDPSSGASAKLFQDGKILSLNSVLPLKTQTTYFKETAQALCGRKSAEDAMDAVQSVFEREKR